MITLQVNGDISIGSVHGKREDVIPELIAGVAVMVGKMKLTECERFAFIRTLEELLKMRIADIFVYCSNVESQTKFIIYQGLTLLGEGTYDELPVHRKLENNVTRFKIEPDNICSVHIS